MNLESDQPSDSGSKTGSDKPWDRSGRMAEFLEELVADTAACVRFFSRLPLPALNARDDLTTAPDFTRISRAAPLAGAIIALPAAGLGMVLGFTALPVLAVAVLMAAACAMTTGALHEDGLADVADGFFGGGTRERRLEIMKDSRIGAFGAIALALSLILRVALLAALFQRFNPADAALIFLGSEALSRLLMVWQWQMHSLARPEGLGARFGKPDVRMVRQAAFVTLPLLIPAALMLSLPALSLGLLLAAGAAHAAGKLAVAKIGGTTGDVLGAVQQLSALGFLLGMLMVS